MLNKDTIYVVLIIFMGFLTRLININQPLLEVAGYFVTTKQDVIDSSVLDYLKDKYEVINVTNEYLIVKL